MSFSPVTEFIIEHRAEGESWIVNSVTPTKEVNVAYHFAGKIYLKNLKPATRYEARAKAKNDEGWSNPSDIFNFATRGTEPHSDTVTDESGVASKSSLATLLLAFCLFFTLRN